MTGSSGTGVEPTTADARFGARTLLAFTALLIVAVPFGLLLFLVEDRWQPLGEVDAGAAGDLHSYALGHAGFVTAMRALSTAGSAPVYLVAFALTAGWLLWRGRPRSALFVVVTALGSSLLNATVKAAVGRRRPRLSHAVAHAGGLSFPSGHAQSAVVAYALVLVVFLPALARAWRAVAVVAAVGMVAAIGFSRVALGVHFVSDVLAGYLLGAAWVAAMAAAFDTWRREQRSARSGDPAGTPTRRDP